MTGCKNSTESGCRCPDHDPGLMAYAPDPDAYAQALTAMQPTRLRIVTPGPPPAEPECSGGYTCTCPDCLSPSARPRNWRKPVRQPYEPRPISARHARAA